jgi:hypothetical protein
VAPGAVPLGTPACAALSPLQRRAAPAKEPEPQAGPTAASLFRGLLCGFERKQLTSHTFEDWIAVEDWARLCGKPRAAWTTLSRQHHRQRRHQPTTLWTTHTSHKRKAAA